MKTNALRLWFDSSIDIKHIYATIGRTGISRIYQYNYVSAIGFEGRINSHLAEDRYVLRHFFCMIERPR